jgi:small subunit ribosomal protein S3Ae
MIRKKMVEIMKNAVETSTLQDLVKKFIPEALGKEIEKSCQVIYPLQSVFIRKVKTIKTPRFDVTRLMEMHGDSAEDVGKATKDAEVRVEALAGAGGRL